MRNGLKTTLEILFVIFCFVGIIGAAVFVIMSFFSVHSTRDARCKQLYGQDFSYTNRISTDCINSKGEGKFLKDL